MLFINFMMKVLKIKIVFSLNLLLVFYSLCIPLQVYASPLLWRRGLIGFSTYRKSLFSSIHSKHWIQWFVVSRRTFSVNKWVVICLAEVIVLKLNNVCVGNRSQLASDLGEGVWYQFRGHRHLFGSCLLYHFGHRRRG